MNRLDRKYLKKYSSIKRQRCDWIKEETKGRRKDGRRALSGSCLTLNVLDGVFQPFDHLFLGTQLCSQVTQTYETAWGSTREQKTLYERTRLSLHRGEKRKRKTRFSPQSHSCGFREHQVQNDKENSYAVLAVDKPRSI